jgi:hypothetical protein
VLFRDIDDREQVAANADIRGASDIQRRCGRNRGIDGISALQENLRASHCRQRLNG